MSDNTYSERIQLRLIPGTLARAEALLESTRLKHSAVGRVTVAGVLREAVEIGLLALESQLNSGFCKRCGSQLLSEPDGHTCI